LAHIQPVKDSFVDATLREHFSDLLFVVPLRETDAHAFVCILFEHKSSVDPLTPLQVLRYMVQSWDAMQRQQRPLAPILPIVVYHGTQRWTVATDFQALFDLPAALQRYTPTFHYHLSDLTTARDEQLKAMEWLGAGMLALKNSSRHDLIERLPEVVELWYSFCDQTSGQDDMLTLLRYIAAAGKHVTLQEIIDVVGTTIPLGGALMGTIAEELIEQGMQKGKQLGMQEGEQIGLQKGEQIGLQKGLRQGKQIGLQKGELLGLQKGIRLALKFKFGADGEALMQTITTIEDVMLLQLLADAIEHAESVEELRAWLADEAG
ncbi:Rpn family recombination-promoting nuclease/putative transposase, partial [Candidatus Viridilinea mediisalina]|uniref:Rpn family recombination-promoting nuclease/putative transposase n=1 Tax=Candidatus Viridilinea mediisalina TaxID=2024553 RepID=UPI0013FE1BC5